MTGSLGKFQGEMYSTWHVTLLQSTNQEALHSIFKFLVGDEFMTCTLAEPLDIRFCAWIISEQL